MAMAVGSPDGGDDEVIGTINTTPLVDVMLVLLIIFLITIPVVTHTVPVTLPHERNQPYKTKPENINIAVDKEGNVYWNQSQVPDNDALLETENVCDVTTRRIRNRRCIFAATRKPAMKRSAR